MLCKNESCKREVEPGQPESWERDKISTSYHPWYGPYEDSLRGQFFYLQNKAGCVHSLQSGIFHHTTIVHPHKRHYHSNLNGCHSLKKKVKIKNDIPRMSWWSSLQWTWHDNTPGKPVRKGWENRNRILKRRLFTWAPTRNWTIVQMVAALPTTSFQSSRAILLFHNERTKESFHWKR